MADNIHPMLSDPHYNNLVLLRAHAQTLKVTSCLPWHQTASFFPSMIYACGWTKDNKLVIVSVDGYSLNNPVTDRTELLIMGQFPFDERISTHWRTLDFSEIGETIELFGIYSGNGTQVIPGWHVETIYPWWPIGLVILTNFGTQTSLTSVNGCPLYEFLADWFRCGFSPNGKHLVLFTPEEAIVFSLKED